MKPLRRTPYICKRCANFLSQATGANIKPQNFEFRISRRFFSNVIGHLRGPRVAVVGSGPAGFYAAYRLMSKINDARVDMYEQLPVPFGLVRYGVAPDHPEVKNCQERFTEVAQDPRFSFIGNIALGHSLPVPLIIPHYDAILFAYGASKDKQLSILGEERALEGVYSARAFVGWYNGLPEYRDLNPHLSAGETATIIGQGNVALDVARILLTPVSALAKTDISTHALEALSKSRVSHVNIVGRRGPLQAAFTIKELRELIMLPSVHFHPVNPLLLPDPTTISTFSRPQKRLLDLLTRASPTPRGSAKSFSLEFLLSPIAFEERPNSRFSYNLERIVFDRMALPPAPECWSPKARPHLALPPGLEIINSKIAFRSIGYQSEPLPDFDALHVPFDGRRGIIPNDGIGRVLAPSSSLVATNLPGFYCTGWVKSGPTGTIATTMMEAFNAADAIAEDWNSPNVAFLNGTKLNNSGDAAGWEGVKGEAARLGLRRVSWKDWERIDSVEKEMGGRMGKEREKFTSPEEMLAVLGK